MAIKKRKKLILRDAGNGTYNSSEVISMLENLTDSIDMIAEQHLEIMKSIKVINKRLDKIESDISDIKCKLDSKIEKKEFDKLEKRVVKVEKLVLA